MEFFNIEYQAVKNEVEKFIVLLRVKESHKYANDIVFHIEGQSVELSELHLTGKGEYSPQRNYPFAKISYFRSFDMWRLFYRDGLAWRQYSPVDFVMLEDALAEIWADPINCFAKR